MKTVLNWSSGKDAALAYHLLEKSPYEVGTLLTTINSEQQRVVMHGIREELLDVQAEMMGLPLVKVPLDPSPSNEQYEHAMTTVLKNLKEQQIETAAFGDIFLEDLKHYREQQLTAIGFNTVFPLWKKNTTELIAMIEQTGIEALIVCVNAQCLGKEFLGRKVDHSLLAELPRHIDPCGENGEYHSFVYHAPFFKTPVSYSLGTIVEKSYHTEDSVSRFYFLDIF